jgi:predicted TIM-barrel fold metal-dependent hydrolase
MVPDLSKTAVDSHFHVFDAHQAQPGARYTPAYAAPPGNMAGRRPSAGRAARRAGADQLFWAPTTDLLLSTLAQHPETLRGVAVVAPTANADTLAPLHAAGVRGIRLNLSGLSHDIPEWSAATALWDALAGPGLARGAAHRHRAGCPACWRNCPPHCRW